MSDKLRAAALAALNMLNDYHDCLQAANILRVGLSEQTVKESLTSQRPWVGLTDREFQPMIQKAMAYYGYDQSEPSHLTAGAGFRVFAYAIEAKLREKNGG